MVSEMTSTGTTLGAEDAAATASDVVENFDVMAAVAIKVADGDDRIAGNLDAARQSCRVNSIKMCLMESAFS